MTFEDIKTVYQQKHNLPSTYQNLIHGHHQSNAPSSTAQPNSNPLQGLHKVRMVRNPRFQPKGLGDLAGLCRKYEITPTLPTPFTMIHTVADEIAGASQTVANVFTPKGGDVKPSSDDHTPTSRPRVVTRMVKKPDSPGRTGHLDVENVQNDSEYLAPVTVGTPPQCLNLCFDTGSSDLWLWSTLLPQNKDANGLSWQIRYGDGSTAGGVVGNDNVTIGGLCVEGQHVELAKNLAQSFEESEGDGLLGLAFGTINTVKPRPVHTPVENMMIQADIPKDSELFTCYLTSSKDNEPDCYTFGYIDSELVKGRPIYYTPVDSSQGFWNVKSTSVIVNGNKMPLAGNTAIMDTGTTLSLIDDSTCKNIYAAVPGSRYDNDQGGFIFPVGAKLPTISFAIGDQQFTLHKSDLAFADIGGGMVYGGIQSRGNMSFSIYGGTLLKGMYAIFDQGRRQFGFVQKPEA
ncbi:Putative aspartic peptidase A1 family, aspartic peptidase domain superfamily [Septoria linicola]|uniref:Aspartic peptidase A1 family, aspartic peptidase domain superfamily n=1 Tax=Septoria linicola TaxID=215465 RepID=A0A9Q9EL03_9PEZI|nr:Putative aspartic peptidase A1 family, aspartic peptidase domain superfamily [Septoria linicola]